MDGVSIRTNVPAADQQDNFQNATLQMHKGVAFSIATTVTIPEEMTSEKEVQEYLEYFLGLAARLRTIEVEQVLSFVVEIGPDDQ